MTEAIFAIPPWVVVLIAAGLLFVIPRKLGYALGFLSLLWVLAYSLLAPAGQVEAVFLGFDTVPLLVDPFSRLLGIGFGVLGAAAVLYAYAADADRRTGGLALTYVTATLALCFSGDWLTMIFAYELMAVTSTLLIWAYGGRAIRRGFRYALWHGIGGSVVLLAVMWHVAETGTLAFEPGGLASGMPLVLGVLGVGINLGFVGLHTWLPDAYPAPHIAASVFLSVFTTKSSVYVLYRALPEADAAVLVAYMGGLMAVYGVVYALLQHDMRALLSYHIVAQVGYMTAGVGIGTSLALSGAMAHLFNNVLYKSLLFMAVGVIIYRTDTEDLYKLGGLWRQMPITAIAFAIGALSIAAFPGFNGFVSKNMVMDAALYEGHEALWILLLVGGLGTFLSFIKLGYYAFLHGPATQTVRDATPGQSIAMVTVAGLCVVLGLFPDVLFDLAPQTPADTVVYSTSNLVKGVGLAVAGVVGFFIVRPTLAGLGHIPDVDRILHPGGFYLGKTLVFAVTESYAAVDRVVAGVTMWCYRFGADPAGELSSILDDAPTRLRSLSPSRHGQTTLHLRSDIGRTMLVMAALTTVVLVALLL